MNQHHQHQEPSPLSFSSCHALLQQLEQVKTNIAAEFGLRLREHQTMLQLALNEAESLAFQTPFPHLVFPTLAQEKAQALLRWASRQQRVQARQLVAA